MFPIFLSNIFWQFGPYSFVLGHFFFLGVGLGLDMKWVGVVKLFGPALIINILKFFFYFFYFLYKIKLYSTII